MNAHGDHPSQLSALDPKQVQAMVALLQEKDEKIQSLQHQLDWFKRQLFGQKSEKKDFSDHPYQTTLAELLGSLPKPQPSEQDKQTITYQRGAAKKKPLAGSPEGSQLRFDESVPVEEIHVRVPELEGDDKDDYEVIGEKVTYRLAQKPASFVVLKYISQTVKIKSTQAIISHCEPNAVFDKSLADVSFLVGMLIEKFVYHMPLYRQHQRLGNNGIVLARSTLTNLVKRSIDLLKPIYQAQLEHILTSKILAIDETPVKAGKAKKGKLKQSYFWPMMGECNEICFTYSSSRAMQHLKSQVGEFCGTILSDGYKAYDLYSASVKQCKTARCWVHCRRYFETCEAMEPEASAIALAYISKLYTIERDIQALKLQGDKKLTYRLEHSNPVVDAFFKWVEEERSNPALLPSNPLLKALRYAQNQASGLRVFLSDPDLPLDTNHVERAIRPIACGRRNWLFCWTELGGEHVGIIQSLISTCRLHDINPYDYLVDVLQRVSLHPASQVEALTPRRWKTEFAHRPMRSDIFRSHDD
ncbi:IS66 family transposase [Teredinibacter turnerae]|uniref:IS66 family transposase n=1 Tax=Teredinibacter turnerae TaxID=2426 RepID=UPI000ACB2F4F|nr:IS66 family transposase [Teredinibacter turnerae]